MAAKTWLPDPETWSQRLGAFTGIPDLIRELGAEPADVLAFAGLTLDQFRDPEGRIPYAAIGRILQETVRRTGCAHVGLLVGRMWSLSDLGLVGEMLGNSPTVGHGLRTHLMFQQLNSEGGMAFLLERGGIVDFGYAIYHPDIVGTDQIYDAVAAGVFNFLRTLCGPGWLPSEVLLPHAKPADVTPYRQLFKLQPRFDAETSAIRFSDQWMKRRVDGADPARLSAALVLASQVDRAELIQKVFRGLRMLLLHGSSSGDELAELLMMHRRTLNRRLEAQGTTFR